MKRLKLTNVLNIYRDWIMNTDILIKKKPNQIMKFIKCILNKLVIEYKQYAHKLKLVWTRAVWTKSQFEQDQSRTRGILTDWPYWLVLIKLG